MRFGLWVSMNNTLHLSIYLNYIYICPCTTPCTNAGSCLLTPVSSVTIMTASEVGADPGPGHTLCKQKIDI